MKVLRQMLLAAFCGAAAAAPLPGQTVQLADLNPRQAKIPTQPQKRLLLRIDRQALARYGGLDGVRFRLMRGVELTRSIPAPCIAVPTRTLRPPRVMSTGELDFGVLFRGTDLSVAGSRWRESTFYLVAEVAGVAGERLLVSMGDLRRYEGAGVLLVLEPPGAPPTDAEIRQIKKQRESEPSVQFSRGPCWRVSD